MKVLILSFSANQVNENSYIPNEIGLTFASVEACQSKLRDLEIQTEHICINKKKIQKCQACGERGWGICFKQHKCVLEDDFNEVYEYMGQFDAYVFVTPVYFWEMSESAKTFFDRLKRCDAFRSDSKIKGKEILAIACAGGSGNGTEETLKSFDILNHFLNTKMIGRIPVTKENFKVQKEAMELALDLLNK